MERILRNSGIAVALALGNAAPAFAQSGAPQSNSGADMQQAMKQCAQMRRQMQPGAAMSADMRAMMRQCDDMDAQMGGGGADQAPRTRTR